jgi:hypothetical protein
MNYINFGHSKWPPVAHLKKKKKFLTSSVIQISFTESFYVIVLLFFQHLKPEKVDIVKDINFEPS